MDYTANQIDDMSIDELESLIHMLEPSEIIKWTGSGYDGATFVEIVKSRG
jgi:hypothetical protein